MLKLRRSVDFRIEPVSFIDEFEDLILRQQGKPDLFELNPRIYA